MSEFIGGTSHPVDKDMFMYMASIDVAKYFDGVCPFHGGYLEGLALLWTKFGKHTYWSAWGTYVIAKH